MKNEKKEEKFIRLVSGGFDKHLRTLTCALRICWSSVTKMAGVPGGSHKPLALCLHIIAFLQSAEAILLNSNHDPALIFLIPLLQFGLRIVEGRRGWEVQNGEKTN